MVRYAYVPKVLRIACFLCLGVVAPARTISARTIGGGEEEPSLRLRIWTQRGTYIQGHEIPVRVELTNNSSKDVYVGRDFWTNASPGRVRLSVVAMDGHNFPGTESSVGLPAPVVLSDFPKALLEWCFSLPPGYSYSSSTTLQEFVAGSGLLPGVYKVRAIYVSNGIDTDTVFNPLLGHPDELVSLQAQNWQGEIASNELVIRIVATRPKGTGPRSRPKQ
jgi:hypothetical protein